MENSKFSRNINAAIEEKKFSKIFIICGSVHANDLFLKIDKYGLEQTFQGIKIKQSSKKIARILVNNVNIKKNKIEFIDDLSLLKKIKQEIELSLPKDSLNQYNYYFDYFIPYCNVEESLNYSVLDKLFSTYSGQFKFLVKIIETPEYIKTFYEINKERKQFILNLPLYFIQQKNLYAVTYKFKIAKIIEMSEFFFNTNYLKDWNPISDLSLVNENKIFNKSYLMGINNKESNNFLNIFKK